MFWYNKTIEVWSRGEKIKNEFQQTVYKEPNLLFSTKVDVQPTSREEIKKLYGYDVDCTYRIFMDNINMMGIHGNLIKYKGKFHEVVVIIDWDDYSEVFINETRIQ